MLVLLTIGAGLHPRGVSAQSNERLKPGAGAGVARPAPGLRAEGTGLPVDVQMFHGPGLPRPEPQGPQPEGSDEDGIAVPRPLDATRVGQIRAALGSPEPGSLYVRLTPSQPDVAGKAAFVFVYPAVVEGGQGYVYFEKKLPTSPSETGKAPPGWVVLWITSLQDRRYLIDCALSGQSLYGGSMSPIRGPLLVLTGPDSTAQIFDFTSKTPSNGLGDGFHLVFGLEAGRTGWYPFTITGPIPPGARRQIWELHACEVTNL